VGNVLSVMYTMDGCLRPATIPVLAALCAPKSQMEAGTGAAPDSGRTGLADTPEDWTAADLPAAQRVLQF